ncbi:MAG TPA: biopolymer transporter ExbD [Candidatus Omnitrophota bacterium]|nr:biopolymer transporter ExbD [Candidatus Omnitrophota bacterium]
MRLKTNIKISPSWETIAFADIVINLFVFFFITFGLFATFDATQRGSLPIELPRAITAPILKSALPLTVTIKRDGTVHAGSQKILLSELEATLNRELSLRKEKNVLVRADRLIPLERFVSVLEVVRNTKARAVAIETETR